MTTLKAQDGAGLIAALKAAAPGDTIALAPGTYKDVIVQNIVKTDPGVSIVPADQAKIPVFTGSRALQVIGCGGLHFIEMEVFITADNACWMHGSKDCSFDRFNVHGRIDGSSAEDKKAVSIRDSQRCGIANSWFHELTDGIGHYQCMDVIIAGNLFELIRDNGIQGGGSDRMSILGNVFRNFDHTGGIHPDAIQFHTVGQTAATDGTTIAGNIFDRGSGAAIQGIFLGDESSVGYTNATISENIIVGAVYNGICLGGGKNSSLSGNVVIGLDDMQSWLATRSAAGISAFDNIATFFNWVTSPGLSEKNNRKCARMTMVQAAALSAGLDKIVAPGTLDGVVDAYRKMALQLIGFIATPPPVPVEDVAGIVADLTSARKKSIRPPLQASIDAAMAIAQA